jgi:hypothetical protein
MIGKIIKNTIDTSARWANTDMYRKTVEHDWLLSEISHEARWLSEFPLLSRSLDRLLSLRRDYFRGLDEEPRSREQSDISRYRDDLRSQIVTEDDLRSTIYVNAPMTSRELARLLLRHYHVVKRAIPVSAVNVQPKTDFNCVLPIDQFTVEVPTAADRLAILQRRAAEKSWPVLPQEPAPEVEMTPVKSTIGLRSSPDNLA